jgi:large subunit ribosomal protein L32
MPLPKRKLSHQRTARRRAQNWKLEAPSVGDCPRCHAPKLPHHVCGACGFYNGRKVLTVQQKDRGGED